MFKDFMFKNLGGGGDEGEYTTHKITIGSNSAESMLGYASNLYGSLEPRVIDKDVALTVSSLTFYLSDQTFYLSINNPTIDTYIYVIRMDVLKGLLARIKTSCECTSNLFDHNELHKVISLYISETPPPFEWTDIEVHRGGSG